MYLLYNSFFLEKKIGEKMKKKTIFISLFLIFAVFCFAIPGVETPLPMSYGEFVYYKDYTFPIESCPSGVYIGFLQYDEETLAVRYYTESPKEGAEDITLYITMDKEKNYVDMTGEKIVGDITSADTETLNYLHDLIYEFAARRKRINNSSFMSTYRVPQEYVQFGGNVTMVYDYYVPVFNLNRILSEEGTVLFEAYAIGKISSSEDTSFQDFKGFKNLPDLNAKDKQIDLSNQWTIYADDMQMLGEDALWFKMYLNTESSLDDEENWFQSLVYTTFLSSDDMIIYAPSIYVSEFGNISKLKYLVYSKEDDIYALNFEVYTEETSTSLRMDSVSIFGDFYYENKSYFDSLF